MVLIDNIQKFTLQTKTSVNDGYGGRINQWTDFKTVRGYLDLSTGSKNNSSTNAYHEQSSHVLIMPKYDDEITDDMRVVDNKGKIYNVMYVDDPVGVHHHLEIYLEYMSEE